MQRTQLVCEYASANVELLARLRGRAFHSTCWDRVDRILRDGAIRTNLDAKLPSAFDSSANSFFRRRNYVSVFDFRTASEEQIADSLMKCSPWQIGYNCSYRIAFFFLGESACSALVPWTAWRDAGRPPEMIVPYVEAGHPGDMVLAWEPLASGLESRRPLLRQAQFRCWQSLYCHKRWQRGALRALKDQFRRLFASEWIYCRSNVQWTIECLAVELRALEFFTAGSGLGPAP